MIKNLFLLLLFAFTTFSMKAQTFENINSSLPGLSLSVCSFTDIDNDGDLDLYLAGFADDGSVSRGLYIYDAEEFTLSEISGLPAVYVGACSWGDVDGDNDIDVVIMGQNASYTDITEVYSNNGDGTFTSLNAGITAAEQGEINLVDFDGDNDLDIALTGTESVNYDKITKFYENDGTGVFTELTGIIVPGMDLGRMKWADYDNDNDLDFAITGYDNGTGGSNTFYSKIFNNNGDGSFSESGIDLYQCWLGDIEWGDFNNDGNIDLVVSGTGGNGAERYTLLYKNNGDGSFTELDMDFPGVSHSGLEWADFNEDGYLDLFIVGETTTPGEGNSVSKIFINNGDETFRDSGVDNLNFSFYGDADSGDYDNDGTVDLVISGYMNASYETSSAIFINNTTTTISEINKHLTIYPIPAKDFLTINSSNLIKKIEIIDVAGKSILSQNANSENVRVNIQDLRKGVYFIRIQTTNKTITEKIIIE